MDGGWASEPIYSAVSEYADLMIHVDLDKTTEIAISAMEALNKLLDAFVVHPTAMTREQCAACAKPEPLPFIGEEIKYKATFRK